MWRELSHSVKATLPLVAGTCLLLLSNLPSAWSQQSVVNQKENTRPETTDRILRPAFITSFSATKWNGYNEIQWTASSEEDTRRFIVEYSLNGLDYQTAGEQVIVNGVYTLKHHILDERPMLYRIKTELLSGKSVTSPGILLNGVALLPVRIYPTIITGNTVNIDADWPIERIIVTTANGAQVYAQDVNGRRDYLSVVVPSLSAGMYWMSFYGRDWKMTSKFIIP